MMSRLFGMMGVSRATDKPEPVALESGLLNFWPLTEASGNRANTERTLPLLEVNGTVTSEDGIRGGTLAARINQANANRLATATGPHAIVGGPFTVSLWIKWATLPNDDIPVNFESDPNNNQWHYLWARSTLPNDSFLGLYIDVNDGNNDYIVLDEGSLVEPINNKDWSGWVGVWHHVAYGHDGAKSWLQVDAGRRVYLQGPQEFPPPSASAVGRAMLGYDGYRPNAAMQFFGHWSRSLNRSEVVALYNGGQGLTRAEMGS